MCFSAVQTGNARFAYDSYRRFLEMFGDVVVGIPHHNFAKELDALKLEAGVWEDKDLAAEQLKVSDCYSSVLCVCLCRTRDGAKEMIFETITEQ